VPANLDPPTANDTAEKGPRRGVVYDIGPSPLKDGLIWAGTDDGLIWRTSDGGAHWQNVTPAFLQPWSKVGIVEPSHFDSDTAYAAIDRHRLDDQKPYILRTRDGGRSWQMIVNGLPTTGGPNSVNVLREDPVQRGLLYTGTERGLFVSFDDGDSWQPLQSGLPTTSVRDITVHENDLVIATHGRGFYVMDDIVPLRALAALPASATRLFPLAAAVRVNEPNFTGTPMPKDEPLAPNPPLGAMIDYILAAPAPVTIRIFDPSGALVNSFSSSDKAAPDAPTLDSAWQETLSVALEWVIVPRPPQATPGHHRFVWDLHYARPTGFTDKDGFNGAWAPPGRYTVELDVGGQQLRQPLDVVADPRIRVSQADFEAQFRLARQIEQSRVRVRNFLKEAAALKDKLKDKPAAQALVARVDALTGLPVPILGAAEPSTLQGISDRLDALNTAVEGSDGAPSPDTRKGYALASQALDAAAQRWAVIAAAAGK
jgi:hypothetical protein